MTRAAAPIVLSPEERFALEGWKRTGNLPPRLVQRAWVIVMAADGVLNRDIARRVGVSRPTVQLWRQRFLALGLAGLEKDAPRPGRIPRIPAEKIRAVVEATLHMTPPNETHWSTRGMARAQGLSEATIRRIWRRHNLKPHLLEGFGLGQDMWKGGEKSMGCNEWDKRSAYLLVQADRGTAEKVWKDVQKWKDTIGVWLVTGSWDMLIWVDANSWEELYDKAVRIRRYNGIKATSSHFVYRGYKGNKWWWEWPAGSWVSVRTPHLDGEWKAMQKWPWLASSASIPGDWDYLVWAGGKNWNEVWNHIWDLNKKGWHTQTMVPLKSWWNKSWKKNWWY